MIFKKGVELEILKKGPTEYTQVPKQQKTIEELEGQKGLSKYLEKEELKHFLHIAKKVWNRPRLSHLFITVIYGCTCR
jgi:hypothetical protein